MAKYPPTHPRYQVYPEWHAWGGQVFPLDHPDLDKEISRLSATAKRMGCSVRIQRQPMPTNTGDDHVSHDH